MLCLGRGSQVAPLRTGRTGNCYCSIHVMVRLPSLKLTARTWKWMVGRLVSSLGWPISGAMLVPGGLVFHVSSLHRGWYDWAVMWGYDAIIRIPMNQQELRLSSSISLAFSFSSRWHSNGPPNLKDSEENVFEHFELWTVQISLIVLLGIIFGAKIQLRHEGTFGLYRRF